MYVFMYICIYIYVAQSLCTYIHIFYLYYLSILSLSIYFCHPSYIPIYHLLLLIILANTLTTIMGISYWADRTPADFLLASGLQYLKLTTERADGNTNRKFSVCRETSRRKWSNYVCREFVAASKYMNSF